TNVQWYGKASDGKLYAGDGVLTLSKTGMLLNSYYGYDDGSSVEWKYGTSNDLTVVGQNNAGRIVPLMHNGGGYLSSDNAITFNTGNGVVINQPANSNWGGIPTWGLQVIGGGIELQAGDFRYFGNLKSYKNSTEYTGYIFVPLTTPLTSTSWDGDARSTTGKTKIDLSAVFGIPAGVKAVLVAMQARDSGSAGNSSLFATLDPASGANAAFLSRPAGLPNDYWASHMGIVPCDANGDVYFQCVASGSSTMDIIIQIWGYWI
ncbi:hypothetical protein GW916_15935, partial [bacterium]|nr:hypothetical protein [bacterium]